MQVHCDEGVATHIDPAPCVVVREGKGEASAGERAGQVLSPENYYFRNADAIPNVEGNTDRRAIRERLAGPAWSKTLACADAPCTGTGRSRVWPPPDDAGGPHREGEEP